MKIEKTLSNMVLMRQIDPESDTILLIPDAVKAGLNLRYAEIVETHESFISPQSGQTIECPVEKGDIVMYLGLIAAAIPVKHGELECILVPSNAIIAVVSELKEKSDIAIL